MTLLAAICSPLPDPPNTTPSVRTPAAWSRATRERRIDAERRVVVERVVLGRAVVDDLMAAVGQVVDERAAELEAGVVGRDVDAHAPSLGIRHPPERAPVRLRPRELHAVEGEHEVDAVVLDVVAHADAGNDRAGLDREPVAGQASGRRRRSARVPASSR